jgi:hypothetical protein
MGENGKKRFAKDFDINIMVHHSHKYQNFFIYVYVSIVNFITINRRSKIIVIYYFPSPQQQSSSIWMVHLVNIYYIILYYLYIRTDFIIIMSFKVDWDKGFMTEWQNRAKIERHKYILYVYLFNDTIISL